jgi:hypothetical protein
VVDTVSPVITDIVFNRLRGQMDVYFQDGLSGMSLADLSNGANYQISATPLNSHSQVRKVIIPTSVTVIPAPTATGIDEAIVTFNRGKVLAAGHYTIKVLAAGIADEAGNSLDGEFYGKYPSGHTDAGSNYVGQITAYPKKVLGAFPIESGYASPKAIAAARTSARVEAVAASRPSHPSQARVAAERTGPGHPDLVDRAIGSLVVAKHRGHAR